MKTSSFFWSRFGSFGLTASFCVEAFTGMLSATLHTPVIDFSVLKAASAFGFAGVIVFAIICANCAASHAQVGLTSGRRHVKSVGIPAAVATCVFTLASVLALYVGWGTLVSGEHGAMDMPSPELVALLFSPLVIAKPAMAWIIQGRITIEEARSAMKPREHNDRNEEPPNYRANKPAAIGAAVVMAGALPGPLPAQAEPVEQLDIAPETVATIEVTAPDRLARWQRVADWYGEGKSAKEIIELTGFPPSTVYKWIEEMGVVRGE